jgi:hypothetical protein
MWWTFLLVWLPLTLPSKFTKVFEYQGVPRIVEVTEGTKIEGVWREGKAPGIRLETERVKGSEVSQYSEVRVRLKGSGQFKLRLVLPDPAGFLDVIHSSIHLDGEETVTFPFSERRPLVTGVPIAKDGSPLVLLIEPMNKGPFSLTVMEIEWIKRESER